MRTHAEIEAVMLISVSLLAFIATPMVASDEPMCITDQAPSLFSDITDQSPYLLIRPGSAAAQSLRPSMNVLCDVYFHITDPAGGGGLLFDLSFRDSLDGRSIASVHIDSHYGRMDDGIRNLFIRVTPGQRYFAVVEVDESSEPIWWYWASANYTTGEAWIRSGSSWEEQRGKDFEFASFGFNDVSSYPLPNPSWTREQWRTNNWKTYPRAVASLLDLDGDGAVDVYTFNNSYLDGTPVFTDGTVNVGALDQARMAPVNLSIALEYTSYLNSNDNRSTLRIMVSRTVDYTRNESESWPAWIMLDNVRFLPLLLSPDGITLDALNLTWNSTLAQDGFRVYSRDVPGHPDGQVWIYIGHFSTQSIMVRGPSWPLKAPGLPAGLFLLSTIGVFSAVITTMSLTKTYQRFRRPREPTVQRREPKGPVENP